MRVYHFLNEKYGLEALEKRRLKISQLFDLNDPFEWAAPAGGETHHRGAFAKMKREMAKDRGLLCFSRDWRNPLLWSHYADRHSGICIGFDVDDAVAMLVKYRTDRIICDWRQFNEDSEYRLKIVSEVMTSKFWHWRYEKEARVHLKLEHGTPENGKYFFDFSDGLVIREIIVGASSEVKRERVKSALGADVDLVTCKKARLAFRTFRVVEQRKASLW